MTKNFAAIYASVNDAVALEQAFFVKLETTRGVFAPPTATDFLYTLGGGTITFNQPFESSPHRSGRHHLGTIKKKKEQSWGFSTYFNIDETLGAASSAEIDAPVRLLFKSLLGFENVSAGAVYNASVDPAVTFSIFENGDKWAHQARGCFVMGCNMTFPGDGEATCEWSGNGKDALLVGIGKSVIANALGNTVTVGTGEGKRFPVDAQVMIVKANGTTRSTDTAAARKVVSVAGDVVTLDGAALTTDSDGSAPSPVYLVYWEPTTKTAINNPVTGLVGELTIAGVTNPCYRSGAVNITNDHELANYCYGSDTLDYPYFIPGSRLTCEVSIEMNLNDEILELFNRVQNDFEAQDILIKLGGGAAGTGRRLEIDLPRVIFPVPAFSVPETGSIPITFAGTAYETALDAADEITVSFI